MSTPVGDRVFEFIEGIQQLQSGARDLKWELTRLRAVRDWALEQQPIRAGDEVEILPTLVISADSGWWPSREMLAPGQQARVIEVDHNSHYGYWYASVIPHEQWTTGSDGTRYDGNPDRPYTYAIPLQHLRTVTA